MEINKCLRFPQLFNCLSDEPEWMKLLLACGKPYDPLLHELIRHGERTYEEIKALPKGYNTAKRISERQILPRGTYRGKLEPAAKKSCTVRSSPAYCATFGDDSCGGYSEV